MKTNSKKLGNAFERKIAKELSNWIYNDPHVLQREATSGGTKTVYVGDIFPVKQLNKNQPEWEYLVECKSGYEELTPTLLNFKIIKNWYLKAIKEIEYSEKQKTIIIIANFKGRRGILFCCDKELNEIFERTIICIQDNDNYYFLHCYNYKDILEYNYKDLFSD